MITKSNPDSWTTQHRNMRGSTTEVTLTEHGDMAVLVTIDSDEGAKTILFDYDELEAIIALYHSRGLKEVGNE